MMGKPQQMDTSQDMERTDQDMKSGDHHLKNTLNTQKQHQPGADVAGMMLTNATQTNAAQTKGINEATTTQTNNQRTSSSLKDTHLVQAHVAFFESLENHTKKSHTKSQNSDQISKMIASNNEENTEKSEINITANDDDGPVTKNGAEIQRITNVKNTTPNRRPRYENVGEFSDMKIITCEEIDRVIPPDPTVKSDVTSQVNQNRQQASVPAEIQTGPDDGNLYSVPHKRRHGDKIHHSDTRDSRISMTPYAISRKCCNLRSSGYEDVDLHQMEPHLIVVDKLVFDYICTFGNHGHAWCTEPIPGDSRSITISTHSPNEYREFVAEYDAMRHSLWIEGIKASSVTDINALLDRLQSEISCIWSRPAPDDVEIICQKQDVERLKSLVHDQEGEHVRYIYDQAKAV